MWKKFDVENPPKNWCLVKFVDDHAMAQSGYSVMAKWSNSNYGWINTDLISINGSYKAIDSYQELPYSTLSDMIYNPRKPSKEPKVWNEQDQIELDKYRTAMLGARNNDGPA